MADSDGYNGYPNYQTWCTALWIDNDEGTSDMVRDMVRDILRDAPSHPRYEVSDALKDVVATMVEDARDVASLAADLLGSAVGMIDFYYLADSYMEQVAEDAS